MTWLTARELAGIAGLPSSERRTRDRLAALGVVRAVGGARLDDRLREGAGGSGKQVSGPAGGGNPAHGNP